MTIAGKLIRGLLPVIAALLKADVIPLKPDADAMAESLSEFLLLLQSALDDNHLSQEEASALYEPAKALLDQLRR